MHWFVCLNRSITNDCACIVSSVHTSLHECTCIVSSMNISLHEHIHVSDVPSVHIPTHTHTHSSHQAPSILVWVFFATLLFPRVAVMVMTVFLFRAKELLRPTFLAKVYLSAALILSLLEEVPNSVLTVSPYFNPSHSEVEDCG